MNFRILKTTCNVSVKCYLVLLNGWAKFTYIITLWNYLFPYSHLFTVWSGRSDNECRIWSQPHETVHWWYSGARVNDSIAFAQGSWSEENLQNIPLSLCVWRRGDVHNFAWWKGHWWLQWVKMSILVSWIRHIMKKNEIELIFYLLFNGIFVTRLFTLRSPNG